MEVFIVLVVAIGFGILWGKLTQKVIDDKGYSENWFWWGFFFGLIALIVAALKSPAPQPSSYNQTSNSNLSRLADETTRNKQIREGYWKCSCGEMNPPYLTTCNCGKTANQAKKEITEITAKANTAAELDNLKMLKEYKELLDAGIITQEDFDKKKAELLKK